MGQLLEAERGATFTCPLCKRDFKRVHKCRLSGTFYRLIYRPATRFGMRTRGQWFMERTP